MEQLEKQLLTFLKKQPTLGQGTFIAKGAVVIGDVTLGDYASVWFNVVLRADINRIVVGKCTNIQDNSVLHLSDDYGCILGDYVTVGHSATVHACTVEDECLIGMGATILDGAVIGAQSIIGAGAVVTPRTVIPPGSLVLGSPAKVARVLRPEERTGIKYWAEKYVYNAKFYTQHKIAVGKPLKS